MIPYFISFLLLGIPLMWIEWGIGRYGGTHGHGSVPGMFDLLTDRKKKWAKYVGIAGVAGPLVVFIVYTYTVSWMLGFSFLSLIGSYFGKNNLDEMGGFLANYQDITSTSSTGGLLALIFFLITIAFLVWVLSRGISGGIEKLALIGMPILFVFAFLLLARVLTLPAMEASPADGLNFIWNPDFNKLGDARVWLAAAGQMFFTLSVGMGSIQTYASYLRKKDDVTLTGLSTAATNEFAEVVLGGTIAIPAAVVFFGVTGATALANGGAYDLGVVAMGVVFQGLPGPEILGRLAAFLWFFLLFIAGITSSVALASPTIAFLQEELGFNRKNAVRIIGALGLGLGMFHVIFYHKGVHQEWDYWAGTFGLVVFAAIEIILFSFVFGINRGWDELHKGADLQIPRIYKFIMKWVTPLFLLILLTWWGATQAVDVLLMNHVTDASTIPYLWVSRLLLVTLVVVGLVLVRKAWSRRPGTAD